jgi:hypothetical protein
MAQSAVHGSSSEGSISTRWAAPLSRRRFHAQDANDVVILQDVADVAKARTWFGSDDLKAAMQKSGVVGSPNVRLAAAA